MSQQMTEQERVRAEEEANALSQGVTAATQRAANSREQVYKDPRFVGTLRNAGLDDDLTADLGPELAGAHVTAFRDPETYEQYLKWITENKMERDIVRNNPGRHVKERPTCMAIAQDLHLRDDIDWNEWTPAMNSDERSRHRRAGDAVVNFKSLAIGGKGIDTVGTVQTSTEVHRNTEEKQSLRERAGKIYK